MAANQHVFLLESLTSCPSGGAPHVHGATGFAGTVNPFSRKVGSKISETWI